MAQAKMAEYRASSAPRVRRHVEVSRCSRDVRVRFLHALEHKFIRPPSIWWPSAVQVSSAICGKLLSSVGAWRGSRLAAVTQQVWSNRRRSVVRQKFRRAEITGT